MRRGLLASASPEEQRAIQAQSLGTIMTRLNELRRTPAISVSSQDLQGHARSRRSSVTTLPTCSPG